MSIQIVARHHLLVLFFCFFIAIFDLKAIENKDYILTKSNKVNIRSGPDPRYIVKFVYIKKNTILKIKNVFDDWYEVEDLEGDSGWVYKNLISRPKKIKYLTIKSRENIFCYKNPGNKKKIAFKVSYLVNFKLNKCLDVKCLVEKDSLKGWCEKKYLWGL